MSSPGESLQTSQFREAYTRDITPYLANTYSQEEINQWGRLGTNQLLLKVTYSPLIEEQLKRINFYLKTVATAASASIISSL